MNSLLKFSVFVSPSIKWEYSHLSERVVMKIKGANKHKAPGAALTQSRTAP